MEDERRETQVYVQRRSAFCDAAAGLLHTVSGAQKHPIDDDPLPTLLRPGMKLTIAFDDISLPLPPMARPDVRQRISKRVLLLRRYYYGRCFRPYMILGAI